MQHESLHDQAINNATTATEQGLGEVAAMYMRLAVMHQLYQEDLERSFIHEPSRAQTVAIKEVQDSLGR